MIYVHTYEVKYNGEQDYIQFYEYTDGEMIVSDSQDIPIAFLIPVKRRGTLNGLMHGSIRHYLGDDIYVRHNSTVSFDDFDFG